MGDEHDDGSDDEDNQYGGGTQDVDAVEQTERITDGEEPDGDDDEDDREAGESKAEDGNDRDGADGENG